MQSPKHNVLFGDVSERLVGVADLPEAEPEEAGDATTSKVVTNPKTGAVEGLPDKIAEMAGQWMQQIFGKDKTAAGAAGGAGTVLRPPGVEDETDASGSMARLQEMMKTAGMTMSMGADGEITMTQMDTTVAGDATSAAAASVAPVAPAAAIPPPTAAAAIAEEARGRRSGSQQPPSPQSPPKSAPKPPPPHISPTPPPTPTPTPPPAHKKYPVFPPTQAPQAGEKDVSWRDASADSAASAATRRRFGLPPSVPIHKRPPTPPAKSKFESDAQAQAQKLRAKVAAAKQARSAAAAAAAAKEVRAAKGDL